MMCVSVTFLFTSTESIERKLCAFWLDFRKSIMGPGLRIIVVDTSK